jgi:hypothetical protein
MWQVASILTSATWRSSIASLSPRRAPYEEVSPTFVEEELIRLQETPIRIAPTPRNARPGRCFEEEQRRSMPSGSLEKKDEHRRI